MSLIQHLNNSVTSQLPNTLSGAETDNMLEQFYALLVTRLCDESLLNQISNLSHLFNKLWIDYSEQSLIEHELSETHHIPIDNIKQIISIVSPLSYEIIKDQANSQNISIYDFLLTHLDDSKAFLPTWAASVIPMAILTNIEPSKSIANTLENNLGSSTNNTLHASESHEKIKNPIELSEQIQSEQKKYSKTHIPHLRFIVPIVLFFTIGLLMLFMVFSPKNKPTTTQNNQSTKIDQPIEIETVKQDVITASKAHKESTTKKTQSPDLPDISEFNENELAQPMSIRPTSGDTIVFEFSDEISDSKLDELTSSTIISDKAKTSRAPTKVFSEVAPIKVEKQPSETQIAREITQSEISELESEEILPDISESDIEPTELYNESSEISIYDDESGEGNIEIIEQ